MNDNILFIFGCVPSCDCRDQYKSDVVSCKLDPDDQSSQAVVLVLNVIVCDCDEEPLNYYAQIILYLTQHILTFHSNILTVKL